MKASKIRRKRANELTRNSVSPHRPQRQHRIPPTYGRAATRQFNVGTCDRKLGENTERQGWRRKKVTTDVVCGGRLIARLGKGTRRRVYCEDCRERRNQRRKFDRLEKRMLRYSHAMPLSEVPVARLRKLSRGAR